MAGSYPDHPSNRMAWHIDGSIGVKYNLSAPSTTVMSLGEMEVINNESNDSVQIGYDPYITTYTVILFPEPRDLYGYYISTAEPESIVPQVSTDTTNGVDGTWTNLTGYTTPDTIVGYRSNIRSVTQLGIVGFRWSEYHGVTTRMYTRAVHLYGKPSATGDRLELWHPTLNQRVGAAHFDWGDAERASTAQINFRVKNLSATKTAGATALTFAALTDSASAFDNAHTFSDDGGTTWSSSLTLASIAPGAISPVYTIKRTYTGSQPLSLWAGYISAIPGTYVV